MLRKSLVVFSCISYLSVFSANEHSTTDDSSAEPIRTTFHISHSNVVLSTLSDMEHQEITASGKFYAAVGAGVGGVTGAGIGAGSVVVGGKLLGVTATNTTIYAGAALGGVVGLGAGIWVGYKYGEAAGEARANERLRTDIEWIQSSYLDVAFHTTQGDETLYYLTMRLRPTGGGWKNCLTDQEKVFSSRIEMKWLIGNARNDGSELFMSQCLKYDSVFTADGQARRLKKTILDLNRFFCPEDDHVHIPHSAIGAEELFKGTLSEPVSIFDIANSVVGLQSGGFLSSCSGKVKTNKKNIEEDVINPAVFSCRLLNSLGVGIAETSLARVLNANRSGMPITRDAIIGELYAGIDHLGLEANMGVLGVHFPHVIP